MADQYKDLETPEEAFAALLAQSKGGPVVEWLEDCQWSRVITPEAWKVVDVCQLNFRVPLPPVVNLLDNMQRAGIEKIECPLFKLSVKRNPPAVEILDTAQLPAEYWRTPEPKPPVPALDKVAIKAAIQAGKEVPGAVLASSVRLEVK